MSYIKKSYAFKGEKMRVFAGHIKKETAIEKGFDWVYLAIIDTSGKGRGETRIFSGPEFKGMRSYN